MRILIENISFSYPSNPVLKNVSFQAGDGEILSILGPNGSGKSTLLRLVARILLPQTGTILLDDRPLNSFRRKELARLIGYVPQDVPWLFPFTVMEVVLMGRSPHVGRSGFESDRDIAVAREMMERTDIVHLAHKAITEISGGERQRVLIARALTQEPLLLLLDEPNAHLDLRHQAEILRILRTLKDQRGLNILSVSHDLNLAASFSNRILLLGKDGDGGSAVLALGSPREVLTPRLIQRVFGIEVEVQAQPSTDTPRVFLNADASLNKERL
ncbi:MAG: ABC transporter ATP-binding protein [Bacteroidia bacterium]|nr:MAG: ABC transporter ATP-binding protein [Bacteroidia bacterium]